METAVCAIARFENKYVKEWIDWHLSIGFSHIYIYDNNREGEERILEVIDVDSCNYAGRVTIIPFHDKTVCPQILAYEDCWNQGNSDWVAFIDLDEYITFSPQSGISCIDQLIESCRGFDAILLNWQVYGDNDQVGYRPLPLQERFSRPLPIWFSPANMWGRQSINGHVKSLVRRDSGFKVYGPHVGKGNYRCCNPDGVEVKNQAYTGSITYRTAFIRHYFTKTIEEYIQSKAQRPAADNQFTHNYYISTFFLYNRPTLRKIWLYYQATRLSGEVMPSLKWWLKQYLKMWLVVPVMSMVHRPS